MRVEKLRDELVVQLPSDVVEKLALKEGDEVDFKLGMGRAIVVERRMTREEALERLKDFKIKLPADWKFDRDEANAR